MFILGPEIIKSRPSKVQGRVRNAENPSTPKYREIPWLLGIRQKWEGSEIDIGDRTDDFRHSQDVSFDFYSQILLGHTGTGFSDNVVQQHQG